MKIENSLQMLFGYTEWGYQMSVSTAAACGGSAGENVNRQRRQLLAEKGGGQVLGERKDEEKARF